MTGIKTREKLQGSIKTFDRAESVMRHIGTHGIKIKESAEEHVQTKEDSPLEYAENKSRLAIKKAGNRSLAEGRQGLPGAGFPPESRIEGRRRESSGAPQRKHTEPQRSQSINYGQNICRLRKEIWLYEDSRR